MRRETRTNAKAPSPRGVAVASPAGRKRLLRLTLGVALGAAAIVGYAWFIPVRSADVARLSQLVVDTGPAGFERTPAQHGPLTASEMPVAAAKTILQRTPDGAGAYSIEWKNASVKTSFAELLVTVVPSPADAAKVRAGADSEYLAKKTLAAEGYAVGGRLTVPSVPAATGVTFAPKGSTTGTSAAAVVVPEGRAVAVGFAEGNASTAKATVVALAQAEANVLRRSLAGFTLGTTRVPLVASVVYAAAAIGCIASVLSAPAVVSRARRRRHERREAAVRSERLARGRKVVKRRAGTAVGRR